MDNSYFFTDITLLITHYNRSKSLERLLRSMQDCDLGFKEVIVSDDGSDAVHIKRMEYLLETYSFTLITTTVNRGLGHNINKGQDAVSTPYTFYVQEDFVPKPALGEAIQSGSQLLKENSRWDIIRFYSFPWAKYPYLTPLKAGFSIMRFSIWPWYNNHLKFFLYSDHPHLKRSSFPLKFGRYKEDCKGDETEWNMCLSFLKNKGQGLHYDHFEDLFEHSNETGEPAQPRPRSAIKNLITNNVTRWLYLNYKTLKNTFQLIRDL